MSKDKNLKHIGSVVIARLQDLKQEIKQYNSKERQVEILQEMLVLENIIRISNMYAGWNKGLKEKGDK